MSTVKKIKAISGHSRIDGVVPGVRGQRAFPINQLRNVSPFIMLDHIGPQKMDKNYHMDGKGHPHRGFETITFMFDGIMDHKDSLGNSSKLNPGSVQRMNAGKGIQHGGLMTVHPSTQVFHEVQLWVNLPAKDKMSQPDIHNVSKEEIPVVKQGDAQIRVIAGQLVNTKGPIETTHPINAFHFVSTGQQELTLKDLQENDTTLVYILKGGLTIEGQLVDNHQTLLFEDGGDTIQLTAEANTELLVLTGEPIDEPVATGGPFVMNTKEEIKQAYADFEAGKFGSIN
jgi:redox-sensitive bicupin YhaK (pirin superfamily)